MAIALSKVYIYSLHVYKSIVPLLLSSMIIIISPLFERNDIGDGVRESEGKLTTP